MSTQTEELAARQSLERIGEKVIAMMREIESLKRQRDKLLARPSVPDGWLLVPKEPTPAMLDRAVAYALNVQIHGEYGWTQYMRDLWNGMLSAAPEVEQ